MAMLRVHLAGEHAHRTPLSYPALWPLFAGRLVLTDDPAAADLLVFAHFHDLSLPPAPLVAAWRRRRPPVVLLSEEPFWDSLWSPDPLARDLIAETALGALPVRQLSHQTSTIFDFDRLPYHSLSEPAQTAHHTARLRRHARRIATLGARAWQAEFAARPWDAAFLAAHRPETFHDIRKGDMTGLCRWRTRLAEAAPGRVLRQGEGWPGTPGRFAIGDWHFDKLMRLDGQARLLSAIENTHHPSYLTEKIFDAFACAALPLVHAGPGHRLHRLGLPPEALVDLWGMTPGAAAERLARFATEPPPLEAFRAALETLAALFADLRLHVAERERLAAALLAELTEPG